LENRQQNQNQKVAKIQQFIQDFTAKSGESRGKLTNEPNY